MRRKLVLIFVIMLLFFHNIKVNAEVIDCEYNDVELTMTYDTEKPFDKNSNPFVKKGDYDSNSSTVNLILVKWGKNLSNTDHTDIDQKLYKYTINNYGCPSGMRVCVFIERSLTMPNLSYDVGKALFTGDWDAIDALLNFTSTLAIMTEAEYRDSDYSHYEGGGHYIMEIDVENGFWENVWDFIKAAFGFEGDDIYAYRETTCQTVNYNGPYVGVNINCAKLSNKVFQFTKEMGEYKKCGADDFSCKSTAISKLDKTEDNIKAQCRSILENQSYEGGEKECIDACMEIKQTLNEYKKDTDLYDDYNNEYDCGFSDRLMVWVINIFKWAKYILPVVVIILGILDFIKAIGNDKEDEMKKSQKRFITRLIAAALVFLIPLIIEFVLIKMGFGYNSCGLF